MSRVMTAHAMLVAGLLVAVSVWMPAPRLEAQSPDELPDGDAERGQQLYSEYGCFACHGLEGQGGAAGPQLAPEPMAYPAFVRYVRAPRGVMPPYSEVLLPDEQDLADIHAFLRSRPEPAPLSVLPPP